MKKKCVAMLLAGGQGSRLYALTEKMAKPAVSYGGKYRIIDFPLSNCVNSGIDTVGILTQYQPLILNEYIGDGHPWDLDRVYGGVHVLPPYQSSKGGKWYAGTANAIYQNINFIERYDPEYVLILSGDHVYKMNYDRMLEFHQEKKADITIAVREVPIAEASRFGIMSVDSDDRITEFAEKPKKPKSNLASMGIYIFTWSKLREYLIRDEADPKSTKDFGSDIIPKMLGLDEKMFAYRFEGYWKDVGTIDSLWEANMDLLDPKVPLDMYDQNWKIYARNPESPPHFVSSNATVENSMVSEGCEIDGTIDFSVISPGVIIEEGAVVTASIIMPGARVEKGAVVEYAILGENSVVEPYAKIGERPENILGRGNDETWGGVTVVGPGVVVSKNSVVKP